MIKPIRIAITTGDIDGIGSEIVSKALAKIKPKKGVLFYIWRSPYIPKRHLRTIDSSFKRITVRSWPEALNYTPASPKEIIDINSNLPPAKWVELSAKGSLFGHLDGMATAPLSKTSIRDAGYSAIGHTEILGKVAKSKELYMAFLGKEFNVILATPHIPLSDVSKKLTSLRLENAIIHGDKLKKILRARFSKKPLGIVGLNPHAGENGIIGDTEISVYQKTFESIKKLKIKYEGPLVPDVAFFKNNWKKYSLYICPYHDQGLIPFKMVHGQTSGIHLTLGLPFVRTSVDHGTAKSIFGKNKANPNSMYEAIVWAIKLAKQSTI